MAASSSNGGASSTSDPMKGPPPPGPAPHGAPFLPVVHGPSLRFPAGHGPLGPPVPDQFYPVFTIADSRVPMKLSLKRAPFEVMLKDLKRML